MVDAILGLGLLILLSLVVIATPCFFIAVLYTIIYGRTVIMDLYKECERKDLPKQLGSGYICGGEWLYRFPIGDGTQELNPICKDCPHYTPGVKVID